METQDKTKQLSNLIQISGTILIVLLGLVELLPLVVIGAAGFTGFAVGIMLQWNTVLTNSYSPAEFIPNALQVVLNAGIPAMLFAGRWFIRMWFSPVLWILILIQVGTVGIMLYAKESSERPWWYRH